MIKCHDLFWSTEYQSGLYVPSPPPPMKQSFGLLAMS